VDSGWCPEGAGKNSRAAKQGLTTFPKVPLSRFALSNKPPVTGYESLRHIVPVSEV